MEIDKKALIWGLEETVQRPDLLLINSPLNDRLSSMGSDAEMLPPIGLAHIATECEAGGFTVGLIDPETSCLTPESTARLVNAINPRWVGINLLTPTYGLARRIVANLKPEILVVAGGAHAKALPEKTLRDPFIGRKLKIIALEDGEFIARGLLQGVPREEMRGVAYINQDGEFVISPSDFARRWVPMDLDLLHHANKKFLPQDPFYAEGRLETNISTSRGCCFNCAFCAGARESLLFGMRSRSIGSVLDELIELREQGISAVRFIDDLFLADKIKVRKFSEAMIDTGLAQDFVWDATGRANIIAGLDKQMCQLLALSGCREVAIGVESGSERILKIVRKKIKPEMVVDTVSKLAEVGIRTKGYFILGFPSETREEMQRTVYFMCQLRDIVQEVAISNPYTPLGKQNRARFRGSMFEFRPYPGTFIYKCLIGDQAWPSEICNYGFRPDIYSEDDILSSFNPVHIENLETRQHHNYGINAPLADGVLPYEIQDMISEAMQAQQADTKQGIIKI
ncbi:MAG: radical SAM protein [bacterium]|nr:radical SAM protein [bacterium]